MISLEEAQEYVLERVSPLDPVELAIDTALGAVVAADVIAAEAVPPFANSAMDGYAVRAADTTGAPVDLKVVGMIAVSTKLRSTP